MEPTKRCPYCAEEVLAVAIKCKHCGSDLTTDPAARSAQTAPAKPAADYGWALLGIPLAGALLIWTWVPQIPMIQGPGNTLGLILGIVVIATAAIAAMEASKVGMQSDKEKGTYTPTAWAVLILFLWVIGYPAYLFKRRHYGLANHLLPAILVMVVLGVSFASLAVAIDAKEAEIRTTLGVPVGQ
jgi:hypothetical protein